MTSKLAAEEKRYMKSSRSQHIHFHINLVSRQKKKKVEEKIYMLVAQRLRCPFLSLSLLVLKIDTWEGKSLSTPSRYKYIPNTYPVHVFLHSVKSCSDIIFKSVPLRLDFTISSLPASRKVAVDGWAGSRGRWEGGENACGWRHIQGKESNINI